MSTHLGKELEPDQLVNAKGSSSSSNREASPPVLPIQQQQSSQQRQLPTMVQQDHRFQAPSSIPPRTSSTGNATGVITGLTNGHGHHNHHHHHQNNQHHPRRPSNPMSNKQVVPESDWISQGKAHRRAMSAGAGGGSGGSSSDQKSSSQQKTHQQQQHHHHQQQSNTIMNGASYPVQSTWTIEKEKIVMGPYDYLFANPGKDVRTQLIAAFNEWLQVPPASLKVITSVVGMLHTASLLIDDVEDSSVLRRGVPVAHSIFGVAQTLNSSNYVYFRALQELQKLNNAKAIEIYTEELINLHRGQGMDLYWRDTLTCPTEADYLEMVGNKTGGLFRLAVKLMQAESGSDKDCVPLVNTIGLLFQIRDDYLNLCSTTYTKNKGLCEDLTEGKFSFPIIHSIRSNPSNLQLLNILKQRSRDEEVKKYAVAYMEGTGSFEHCRKVLREMAERAKGMIGMLDAGEGKAGGMLGILERMAV